MSLDAVNEACREAGWKWLTTKAQEESARADRLAVELRDVVACLRREVESRYTKLEAAKAIPEDTLQHLLRHGHLEKTNGSYVWT